MTKTVAVITCYSQPNYIRAVVLRNAIKAIPRINETIVIKNQAKGFLRYPEVLLKLIWVRLKKNPDTFVVTFRGYEILPFVKTVCFNKSIIFDEFINPIEWAVHEHKKLKKDGVVARLVRWIYRRNLMNVAKILTDTQVHANYSSELLNIPVNNYAVIPVGTDESIFRPQISKINSHTQFVVFYYGSMLPLHGIDIVCSSAIKVAYTDDSVRFVIIGGNKETKKLIEQAIKEGANIEYKKWVNYSDLPNEISRSDLCLGGPFGNTIQSNMVITGKTYQFLASQKPTVVGKIVGSTGFVNRYNVLIVKQGDSDELTKTILWAKANKKHLARIAKNGRQLFDSSYSTSQITKLLNAII